MLEGTCGLAPCQWMVSGRILQFISSDVTKLQVKISAALFYLSSLILFSCLGFSIFFFSGKEI